MLAVAVIACEGSPAVRAFHAGAVVNVALVCFDRAAACLLLIRLRLRLLGLLHDLRLVDIRTPATFVALLLDRQRTLHLPQPSRPHQFEIARKRIAVRHWQALLVP